MAITDIPIFSMLRTRMNWAQERQRLLTENVANADTPNFRPSDLDPPKFDGMGPKRPTQLALATTDAHHLTGGGVDSGEFERSKKGGFEVRPTGNAVNLENEVMKVADNQMEYQAATALYTRSLGLIKTALGQR